MNLAELKVGGEARILSVRGNSPVTRRLMEMGLVPGVLVRVIKTAPFGDPIEIRVRNYNLALRRVEAQSIEIK
ncbi:MAG: FeoA family protein [Pyrinomonadaceae bacterium]